jgi:hypothetical protein
MREFARRIKAGMVGINVPNAPGKGPGFTMPTHD